MAHFVFAFVDLLWWASSKASNSSSVTFENLEVSGLWLCTAGVSGRGRSSAASFKSASNCRSLVGTATKSDATRLHKTSSSESLNSSFKSCTTAPDIENVPYWVCGSSILLSSRKQTFQKVNKHEPGVEP